ncbi:hypothetical protein ABW21_db0202920 [Orbilia brochopaga]|nr:hypothetical protein ABW21_db0202920 [Drechslerella brochopaga]
MAATTYMAIEAVVAQLEQNFAQLQQLSMLQQQQLMQQQQQIVQLLQQILWQQQETAGLRRDLAKSSQEITILEPVMTSLEAGTLWLETSLEAENSQLNATRKAQQQTIGTLSDHAQPRIMRTFADMILRKHGWTGAESRDDFIDRKAAYIAQYYGEADKEFVARWFSQTAQFLVNNETAAVASSPTESEPTPEADHD